MKKITVALASSPYEVVIGPQVRHEIGAFVSEHLPRARRVAIVTTSDIHELGYDQLDLPVASDIILLPPGEAAKNFATVAQASEQLASLGLSRHDAIITVGGGATTDVGGFLAAIYLRGIAVLHVPTTLVGQVDAAIGGKTGINLAAGKNLVGAFHQPRGVWCDTATLATLPPRELSSGYGEIAKCWLLAGHQSAPTAADTLDDLVTMSIALKARIVAADEFEGGERALLNYGHTLAHAIESLALERDVNALRHGEAVGIGLFFAVRLALALGRCDDAAVSLVADTLDYFGLSSHLAGEVPIDEVMARMASDKKAHHDLTFVLPGPEGISVVRDVDPAVVRDTLERFLEET